MLDSRKVSILPKTNFKTLLEFFYGQELEAEVKFGRFRADFYHRGLQIAFEYDGIHHYSVIQKIESDRRKEALFRDQGIQIIRWPFYFMPTSEVCMFLFEDAFSTASYQAMLTDIFNTTDEFRIKAPGFHSTKNIPANFIWPGIDKFVKELQEAPVSLRDQVIHSLVLYPSANRTSLGSVIPLYHPGFMNLFRSEINANNLNYWHPNNPEN